jgi:hypothetical protein
MTYDYKTNPLYLNLKDKLKAKYKSDFEDKDDYDVIHYKSMTFVIEAYDDTRPNTFSVIGGLNSIELYDGDTQVYNEAFTLEEWLIKSEKDVDSFLDEFNFMVKDADADKRCVRIMKAVDKLYDMVDDDRFDRDFVIDYFHNVFGIY